MGAIVGACATITAGWLALRGVRGQIEEMRLTRWIEFVNTAREQAEKELPGLREALTYLDKAIAIPDEHIETWTIRKYAHEFMLALRFPDSKFNYYNCDWGTLIAKKIPNAPEHYKIDISRALYNMYNIDDLPSGSTEAQVDAADEVNLREGIKRIIEINGMIEKDISDASDAIIRQREKSRELREELRKRLPE